MPRLWKVYRKPLLPKYHQNRLKYWKEQILNTCKLFTNDNAKISTEIANIYKRQEFKCPSTLLSLPERTVGNLPFTILLELSFKVKKTNKQTNPICAISYTSGFRIHIRRHNIRLKIALPTARRRHRVMYFQDTSVAMRIKGKRQTE